jgi:ankyrin repeat protein
LDRGADTNIKNNDGDTPLLQAVNGCPLGRLEVVQVLLDGGADNTVQNNNGISPLQFAARNGHLEFDQVLLERGADINVRNNDEDTPLISAAIGGAAIRARLESSGDENNNQQESRITTKTERSEGA